MNEQEICGRCLVQVDARTSVRAISKDGQTFAPNPTDPVSLKRWIEDEWYGNNAQFQINDTVDRFKAISTWYGDPVCSYHLLILADGEMRRPR